MRKLCIAHVSATFPPNWTGTGLVCDHNARELARRGHIVHVYTAAFPGSPDYEIVDGMQVHRLQPWLQIGNAPLLPGLTALQDVDLIHLHYPFIFGAELVCAVSLRRKIPYVLTYHNDLVGDGVRRTLFQAYSQLTASVIFSAAHCLIPVSLDYARCCRMSALFRRHPRLCEVPNGVDPQVFRPHPVDPVVRTRLNIPPDAPFCIFVGALDRAHHFKGLDTLFQALARPACSAVHLLVIGGGDMHQAFHHRADKMHLQGRVHFAGKIAHADLPPYLSAADFLVLPSLPPESFGLVLIEALACAVPVIASRIPGVRTVVSDCIDGFLAEPGDPADLAEKILRMSSLPAAERRGMGAAGRLKVLQRYTWQQAAGHLETIYIEILRDTRSSLVEPA